MQAAAGTNKLEGVTVVNPKDTEYLSDLADKLAKRPEFWEDTMRVRPIQTFMGIFANPSNFVVDLNGDGVLAFVRGIPKYRLFLYGVSWGRKAMGNPEQRFAIAKAAATALGAAVIEGVTKENNRLARRAMEDAGMHYRGRVPDLLCYDGQRTPAVWYEITREELGLDSL